MGFTHIKCVTVGDSGVGKSWLVETYTVGAPVRGHDRSSLDETSLMPPVPAPRILSPAGVSRNRSTLKGSRLTVTSSIRIRLLTASRSHWT